MNAALHDQTTDTGRAVCTRQPRSGGVHGGWRRQLVEANAGLAYRVARAMYARFPRVLEVDDLVSAAFVGLIDAAGRYEPARGVPFQGYAVTRVRGAVLDALRAADRVPAITRRKRALLDQMCAAFEARHGRPPTSADLAGVMEMDLEAVEELRLGAQRGEVVTPSGGAAGATLLDPPARALLPDAQVDQARWRARLSTAIAALPERERFAVRAYCLEERPLAEVADRLGVSPSRVCQLCRRAVERMRETLGVTS